MIGNTISHYKILEKLGEGGMGVVYKAQDMKLDRLVALKFLPHHLTTNETEKARFLQEAKSASSLNHPNVCTIYGMEEHEGQQYIEMEFVDGVTLRHKLPIGKMIDVLAFAVQIADALQEAHSKGIVHRDIKADNIMINAKNQIKVMDFGLAKLKGSMKLTRTSSTVGTLAYMAPEQIQGEEVDNRSDIFSFGVVLFEMLTGKLPFRGDHEAAMMYSIMNEEPESAQKYKPDASPEFLHILARGLEKDPGDRYQTVQEMLIDLRRLQKQSTKVSRKSMADMPIPHTEQIAASSAGVSSSPSKKRPSKIVVGMLGLALIVGLVILFKMFSRNGASGRSEPFASINLTRLTTSGKASIAAISPDGKYVVHVSNEGEKHGLWVRQVATASNVNIVPPANMNYMGITFGNDGNFIYYVANNDENPNGALFEIPVLGGTPRKIIGNLASAVTFSPDGKRIAFIRQYPNTPDEALIVANSDGTEERKLAVRSGVDFFISAEGTGPSWSPDGKIIAASAASNLGVQHINLTGYFVVDGSQKLLTEEKWGRIGHMTWMPDGRGLVFVGNKMSSSRSQVWFIPYPEGAPRSITNDLSSYDNAGLGVTADGKALIATDFERRSNIWVLKKSSASKDLWDAGQATRITSGVSTQDGIRGLDWIGDHAILYSSMSSKNWEIWSLNADGSNQHKLSLGERGAAGPSVSPDSRFLAYVSERDTTPHIYRANIDGENALRMTTSEDYIPRITSDQKWIVYYSWGTGTSLLYKVPFGGGDTINISANTAADPSVSPDSKFIACMFFDTLQRKMSNAILTLDGRVMRIFTLPYSAARSSVHWYPDGKSISYIDTRRGVSNLWILPVTGNNAKQITNFTSGLIFEYAWSKDGENLALARGEETSDVVLITENELKQ